MKKYSAWMWLIASLLVIGTVSALTAPSSHDVPLDVSSARADGGLALYLWLRRIGYRVTADTSMPRLDSFRGTLAFLNPGADAGQSSMGDLLRWVRGGGRLVLATEGDGAANILKALGLQVVPTAGSSPVSLEEPLLVRPSAAKLTGYANAVFHQSSNMVVAASSADGPVLIQLKLGAGQVWAICTRNLLDNGHIGEADNRRLLLNLVGHPGSTVAIAAFQATSAGQADWLTGTVWGIGLLFAVAVLILYRFVSGWRFGPPLRSPEERSRAAFEHVTSLAALLRRANRRDEVLSSYQNRLRRIVAERTGDQGLGVLDESLRDEVDRLLVPTGKPSEQQLLERAAAIARCEAELRRARV